MKESPRLSALPINTDEIKLFAERTYVHLRLGTTVIPHPPSRYPFRRTLQLMASTTPQPYNIAPGNVAPASDRYNVLSIVGFILAFVISIAGLVVSIIALSQIKKTGEKGRGLALAGIIISVLAIILTIVGYIVLFAVAANHGTSTNP